MFFKFLQKRLNIFFQKQTKNFLYSYHQTVLVNLIIILENTSNII